MLPNMDHPEAFGQHPNADITSQIQETRMMFETLLSLQPQTASGVGESREEKVRLSPLIPLLFSFFFFSLPTFPSPFLYLPPTRSSSPCPVLFHPFAFPLHSPSFPFHHPPLSLFPVSSPFPPVPFPSQLQPHITRHQCHRYRTHASAFCQPSPTCRSAFPAQHLRPSGVLSCWPDGLELTPGFYLLSSEQYRLF